MTATTIWKIASRVADIDIFQCRNAVYSCLPQKKPFKFVAIDIFGPLLMTRNGKRHIWVGDDWLLFKVDKSSTN